MSLERLLLTLGTFAFAGVFYTLMLKGWRTRQRRQRDLPAPPTPPQTRGELVVPPIPGLYVGTTSATDWLDRIAVHSLSDRATARLSVSADGVHVDRDRLPELYLPFSCVVAAGPGDALAGKVIGKGGMLLVSWRLGDATLTSGFRADDHSLHPRLAEVISARLPVDPVPSREAS